MLGAAVGLIWLGRQLSGPHPPHGMRAGVVVGAVGLLAVRLVSRAVGIVLERNLGESNPVGMVITLAIGAALLAGRLSLCFRPRLGSGLLQVEDQRRFSAASA